MEAMMIQVRDGILMSDDVETEVRRCHYRSEEISDACARTIAGFWQSPGTIGLQFAVLASGAPVDSQALADDLHATRREAERYASLSRDQALELDMFGTWLVRKVNDSKERELPGLLDEYAAWDAERDELSARDGQDFPDNPVGADEWHNSDDAGIDLLRRIVAAVEPFTV